MSNLYTLRKSAAAVAAHFGIEDVPDIEIPTQTTPTDHGLVVRQARGVRTLQLMTWGFPRQLQGETKPVNLVANLTSPMWDEMVQDPRYRCIIPLTHFAEPAGEPGMKTRLWFSVREQPIFAWAGFCRNTPEWGPVFAGMTTDSNDAVMPFNDRMPVLLRPNEYDRWLTGPVGDVIGFQFRAWPAAWLEKLPTADRWRSGAVPHADPEPSPQLALNI